MRPDEFASSQRYCASAGKDGGQVPALASSALAEVSRAATFGGAGRGGYRAAAPLEMPGGAAAPAPVPARLPGQPGRGGSPRSAGHAGLGTPTHSQLGFRLGGLGGGRATPEEAPEKVWACSPRAAAGRRGAGAGQPGPGVRGAGAAPRLLGGRGGGTPLPAAEFSLPRAREAARFLPRADLPFLSSLFNYPSEFEWIILWKI